MSPSRLRIVLFMTLLAAFPSLASGQSDSTPRRVCWRGQPQPACDVFWITELGLYPRLAGFTNGEDPAVNTFGSIEVGRMVNQGKTAQGVLVQVGRGYGSRYGLLLRQRRWLGNDGTFDVTGGVVKTKFRPVADSHLEHSAYGLTADVAIGWRDYGQLSLRGDLLRAGDRIGGTLYGGVRLGSQPAVIAGATGALLLSIYVVSFVIGMGSGDF